MSAAVLELEPAPEESPEIRRLEQARVVLVDVCERIDSTVVRVAVAAFADDVSEEQADELSAVIDQVEDMAGGLRAAVDEVLDAVEFVDGAAPLYGPAVRDMAEAVAAAHDAGHGGAVVMCTEPLCRALVALLAHCEVAA